MVRKCVLARRGLAWLAGSGAVRWAGGELEGAGRGEREGERSAGERGTRGMYGALCIGRWGNLILRICKLPSAFAHRRSGVRRTKGRMSQPRLAPDAVPENAIRALRAFATPLIFKCVEASVRPPKRT